MSIPTIVASCLALLVPASSRDTGDSLEELLRRNRALAQEARARLAYEVAEVLADLEALGTRPPAGELAALHERIDGLGPEAPPLLVPSIDPGPEPAETPLARSRQITRALTRARSAAIAPELLRISAQGSPVGRRHAVRLLGHSPARDVVEPRLIELAASERGELKLEALSALARLGGPASLSVLERALTDPDEAIRRVALRSLAEEAALAAAPRVLELARSPRMVAPLIDSLVLYLRAVPSALDADMVAALVAVASERRVPVSSRVQALDALPGLTRDVGSDPRRELEALEEVPDSELREAVLVCLTLLGDRGARRTLLRSYDRLVEQNDRRHENYEKRARVLLRIEDYDDAARDFSRAVEILESREQFVPKELRIDQARAFARQGRERQAHEALLKANLRPDELRELALDPAFAGLREHARYGRIFEAE